ncbi:MAG TPA: efflux RND transporter periplasmic adaptor subunit [Candidatus Limnocylindrales bacterium]|jgi:HlyD family secretion protein|nr:efflux RND transporter periplasmic adaptor subunit [Candidatus Limnocylindrales bacterium]
MRLTNSNRGRIRAWVPYLGALLLIGLIIAGLWPRPVPVETALAAIGTLRATVNEEGKTRIKQRYTIAAPVAGQLRRIPFKPGAEIKASETVVAVIDPLSPTLLDPRTRASTEAKRDTALANREKAKATHIYAASELRRVEKLFEGKTSSLEELEAAQMREATAAKEEAAGDSALRQAEAELAEFGASDAGQSSVCVPREVTSPIAGRVLKVLEESTRVVSAGTPLLEVGDPSDLEVVVEVLSRDGAAIAPGTKVEFEQWGGDQPLIGRVRLVEPAAFTKISALGVEEQRVNVVADLVTPLEARRNLGDNFRVEAKIIVWEASSALKVPAGALFRQGEQWATFVLENGTARLRPVKVGRASGTETQILEGLKPGEEVIVYPGSRVKDGQRVRPIKI